MKNRASQTIVCRTAPVLVGAALLLLAVQPGHAVQLKFSTFYGDTEAQVQMESFTGSVPAGSLIWDVQNGDQTRMVAFCIEPAATILTGAWTSYNPHESAPAYISQQRERLIGHWFGHHFDLFSLGSGDFVNITWERDEAIAFQLGLWELIYEDYTVDFNDPTSLAGLDVTDGAFAAWTSKTDYEGALTLANQWLAELDFSDDGDYMDLLFLTHGEHQDLVTGLNGGGGNPPNPPKFTSGIPEPVTGGLAAMGLGALCLAAGRRRRQR